MLRFVPFVFLIVVVSAQSKLEWLPEDLYNPLDSPRECGLNSDDAAFVCDPNRILGEHIQSINWHLKDAAYNSTKCPCSNYYCEFDIRKDKGYHIGVALVKKMTLQTNADGRTNSPADQAQLFAYKLENSQWKMGNCEEDIIIFYSVEDRVLALYGGSTAMTKLSKEYRNLLIRKVSSRFEDGKIVEALHNLIYDIKKVLNCDSSYCELYEITSSSSSLCFNTALVLTTFLTFLISVFISATY